MAKRANSYQIVLVNWTYVVFGERQDRFSFAGSGDEFDFYSIGMDRREQVIAKFLGFNDSLFSERQFHV